MQTGREAPRIRGPARAGGPRMAQQDDCLIIARDIAHRTVSQRAVVRKRARLRHELRHKGSRPLPLF
jgi:hypothetical protein